MVIDLLVIIIALVVDDVEEAELIDTLARRHHTEPVTELLLLEELLGPVCHHCQPSSSSKHENGTERIIYLHTYKYFK